MARDGVLDVLVVRAVTVEDEEVPARTGLLPLEGEQLASLGLGPLRKQNSQR